MNVDNIFIGSAELIVDDVSVGFTQGGLTITREREYEDIIRPGHIGVVGKRKIQERVFIETTLLESTMANLKMAWDLGSDKSLWETDENVHVRSVEVRPTDELYGENFVFSNAVFVGTGSFNYNRDSVTAIPVNIEVLLGIDDYMSVPTIDGVEVEGLFYTVNDIERFTVMETFGGFRRTSAGEILDVMIEWSVPGVTTTVKDSLLESRRNNVGSTIEFAGYDNEEYSVYYEGWDAPEPREGLWVLSGSFRVVSEVGS